MNGFKIGAVLSILRPAGPLHPPPIAFHPAFAARIARLSLPARVASLVAPYHDRCVCLRLALLALDARASLLVSPFQFCPRLKPHFALELWPQVAGGELWFAFYFICSLCPVPGVSTQVCAEASRPSGIVCCNSAPGPCSPCISSAP